MVIYFYFLILLIFLLMHLGNIVYYSFMLYDLFILFFIVLVINNLMNEEVQQYLIFLFILLFLAIAMLVNKYFSSLAYLLMILVRNLFILFSFSSKDLQGLILLLSFCFLQNFCWIHHSLLLYWILLWKMIYFSSYINSWHLNVIQNFFWNICNIV